MPEQDLASLVGAQKATSIGPPQPGTRLQPTPTDGPLTTLARWLVGEMRPTSVVAQDPYGITGWERGAGQPPLMLGTTDVGAPGMLDALGQKFPRLAKAIKAYHGSPHDFERFSMSKIGTGEGAQAYGHGLYFAENPTVAQDYRASLAGRPEIKSLKIGGLNIGPHNNFNYSPRGNSLVENIRSSLAEDLLIDEQALVAQPHQAQALALQKLDAKIASYAREWPEALPAAKQLREQLARPGAVSLTLGETPGKMYEVAIHADPESFLDWDKPLTQQPKIVNALRKLGLVIDTDEGPYLTTGAMAEGGTDGLVSEKTGEDAYHAVLSGFMERSRSENPAASTSKLAKRAGIPGIKYLDQGSRAAGQGSYNYVVFDDKLIEIMKKYGVGLAVAQQIYQRQQQEQAAK